MLCSVIIPVYQGERFIEQCLRSVLCQSMNDLEILVADDASTDHTASIVCRLQQEDARIRYLPLTQHVGPAEARNKAIANAKGTWIALLDADDEWTPDKLSAQLHLAQRCNADLLCTGALYFHENDLEHARRIHVPPQIDYASLLRRNEIISSSVLVRRSVLPAIPFERSDLHEDYICWLRLLQNGCRAVGLDEPLTLRRLHEGAKTAGKLHSAHMLLKTYRYLRIPLLRRIPLFFSYVRHGVRTYLL